MLIGSNRSVRRWRAVSAALGLLLVGIAATPAQAETVREMQWHLDAMQVDEMWKVSTGKGVTVAVIDSGVDDTLPDLKGQVLPGLDFSTEEPGDETHDYDGHGTKMAVMIAGTGAKPGGRGSFGVAPDAKILPIRLPREGEGTKLAFNSKLWNGSLSRGIRHAVDSGAKVINISQAVRDPSDEVAQSVEYALDNGSLVFAGVGNDGETHNALKYPAGTPGVVGVSAVDEDGSVTPESQSGPQVDLAAFGDRIISACPGGSQLCESHGTSDATALASASAALIWSKYPEWTNNQVLRVMINTAGKAKNGMERTDRGGYGVVRPRIALKTPGDPGPADVYPLPDLAEAEASAEPDPEPSAAPDPAAGGDGSGTDQAATDPQDEDGGSGPWIALGVGAAVILAGAVAAVVVRRRRAAPQAQPVGAPPYPPQAGPPPPSPGQAPQGYLQPPTGRFGPPADPPPAAPPNRDPGH
ncbi:type VII secretion-associated serine protease mycosin [Streptomyces sp. NPDC090026]|uniref:type VII secretion-associated serine protease mycosin n=1 Tax=Streptomyces sp. NPDC090026 TaxID=3365923 RepID=UPI0037F21E1B